MVVAQLPDDEDLDSYARSGVLQESVPWIAPGLAVFLVTQSGNAHFWIDTLDKVG